ncbi:MAG: hypothetical protein QY326_03215 [Bdellovibrionota bacterium]|nr:MAG: hypothetical protein QY326_03215 [Bdellovibrionota bacterium]
MELPLTPYLNWEFLTYQVTARFGQRILVTDITNDAPSSQIAKESDFLIFDNKAVLAHDYSRDGLLQGAWLIEDPQAVERYVHFFQEARARSIPLGAFERLHLDRDDDA